MRRRIFQLCALMLALSLMPGVAELLENAAHVVNEGHWAHTVPDGDQHDPSGPEHGCTPTLHLCACHANLTVLGTAALPPIRLLDAGFSALPGARQGHDGFQPPIERPPRS